jgi:hypothetical protein
LGVGALKDAVEYIGVEGGEAEGSNSVHEVWCVAVVLQAVEGRRRGEALLDGILVVAEGTKETGWALYLLHLSSRHFTPTLDSIQK